MNGEMFIISKYSTLKDNCITLFPALMNQTDSNNTTQADYMGKQH